MRYADIIKQTEAYRELSADAEKGRVAHGYLLVSRDNVAIGVLTRLFIAACEGLGESRVEGSLADVAYYTQKLSAADAGEMADAAYLTPVELGRRYFIVKQGESMSESCQNKLLKTFEEPPEGAVFVVMTTSEEALLPTVRSRLRTVRLLPLSDAMMERAVGEYFDNNGLILGMNDGSLTSAEKFMDPVYNELLSLTVELLGRMRKSAEILPYAARLGVRKDYLRDILDMLEVLLHDCMVYSLGRPDAVKMKFLMPDIRELSEIYDADVVLGEREVLTRARRRLDAYGNMSSIIDELLFSLLEVKAKCQR